MTNDVLIHYGRGHLDGGHSGRYPWGSGDDSYQRSADFLAREKKYKEQGFTNQEIDKIMGMGARERRDAHSLATNTVKSFNRMQVKSYREQGMSPSAIANKMEISESTVRKWLNDQGNANQQRIDTTIDILKKSVADQKYVDVGKGVASVIGVSDNKLSTALKSLKDDGYGVYEIKIPQIYHPGSYTTQVVLAAPGIDRSEVLKNRTNIGLVMQRVSEDGKTKLGLKPIQSISSKRVGIRYAEDGGKNMDGVIELRRGVKGLDLGNARYAQVRIGVDGKYYLKGMAIYSDDLPDGIDIRFNTNKSKDVPKLKVLKPMKTDVEGNIDKDNPFGSAIKPGGQRGYLNIVREEGEWDTWSRTLASQMLSKQSYDLAKNQLKISKMIQREEFDSIRQLTNPTVRKYFLNKFADGCDSAAVELKAAAMPRQSSAVILPVTSMKENQIYAPGYKNGEHVILIRYPHGGTFEIPELIVNNRNSQAKRMFAGGDAKDAVGINTKVAERLSGADFDGDTVLVIPNNPGRNGKKPIKTTPPLAGLKDFDPSAAYPGYEGMVKMTKRGTQREMGIISNLITDMTIKGAPPQELERAVRHSMVVIDAEKHRLNWRQSEKDNGIAQLRAKWQGDGTGHTGAATLISRASSQAHIDEVSRYVKVNPRTGELMYTKTGRMVTDRKTGKAKKATTKTTKMAVVKDARELLSNAYGGKGTPMERLYADYANSMKAMANEARKESMATKENSVNTEAGRRAKQVYAEERASIRSKIRNADRNKPLERKALWIAQDVYRTKLYEHPEIRNDPDEKKKIRTMALRRGREVVGKPSGSTVTITPKEWQAIQAGAISKSDMRKILEYADQDELRKMAMPKRQATMSAARTSRAKAMHARGYTWDEIADVMGVSVSTVKKAVA